MNRILLVDDDEGNRLTLSALLEDEGFQVDLACSCAEATTLLESAPPEYAAVLLDHCLGDGYGSDLIPLFRRALPGAKLVAMSGSIGADAISHGSDAELPKGLHFPVFLARLQALLGTAE